VRFLGFVAKWRYKIGSNELSYVSKPFEIETGKWTLHVEKEQYEISKKWHTKKHTGKWLTDDSDDDDDEGNGNEYEYMRRFRFSQRYCLRFRSPGRLHCVDLSVVADVSNELIDFVFRVKQSWTIHIYIYMDIYRYLYRAFHNVLRDYKYL